MVGGARRSEERAVGGYSCGAVTSWKIPRTQRRPIRLMSALRRMPTQTESDSTEAKDDPSTLSGASSFTRSADSLPLTVLWQFLLSSGQRSLQLHAYFLSHNRSSSVVLYPLHVLALIAFSAPLPSSHPKGHEKHFKARPLRLGARTSWSAAWPDLFSICGRRCSEEATLGDSHPGGRPWPLIFK